MGHAMIKVVQEPRADRGCQAGVGLTLLAIIGGFGHPILLAGAGDEFRKLGRGRHVVTVGGNAEQGSPGRRVRLDAGDAAPGRVISAGPFRGDDLHVSETAPVQFLAQHPYRLRHLTGVEPAGFIGDARDADPNTPFGFQALDEISQLPGVIGNGFGGGALSARRCQQQGGHSPFLRVRNHTAVNIDPIEISPHLGGRAVVARFSPKAKHVHAQCAKDPVEHFSPGRLGNLRSAEIDKAATEPIQSLRRLIGDGQGDGQGSGWIGRPRDLHRILDSPQTDRNRQHGEQDDQKRATPARSVCLAVNALVTLTR